VEVHIYIGFKTLKVKCTQYGICSPVAFKNARAMFFLFSSGAGSCFRASLKNSRAGAEISREGCHRSDPKSLKVHGGGDFNVRHYLVPLPISWHDHTKLSIRFQPWNRLLGIMFINRHWSTIFVHYYSKRCWRRVSEVVAGVIKSSY
jgi:hypothetical protein